MKILLINHYAGSLNHGMEFRPFYFAREWVRNGHNVTIVAASESHVRKKNPIVKWFWLRDVIEGINYFWFRTPKYKGNGLGRVMNMLAFVLWLLLGVPYFAFILKPQIVIASSTYPLDILPSWLISRFARAKLVFEVHDLWPLSPIELGGMSPNHPFIMMMQVAENFAYNSCDKCVSLLSKALPYMKEHGLSPDKFAHIPNGIDISEWNMTGFALPELHRTELARIRANCDFIVGYIGTHGIANSLESLIDAAAIIDGKNIGIVLVGDGYEKESLIIRSERLRLQKIISFLPAVPKALVPSLIQSFDALFIASKKNPLYRFGVSPNKIFEYMMSGKPIISAIDGVTPACEAMCGISVEAESAAAIASGIRTIASSSKKELLEMGLRGRVAIMEKYVIEKLAHNFLIVCEDANCV